MDYDGEPRKIRRPAVRRPILSTLNEEAIIRNARPQTDETTEEAAENTMLPLQVPGSHNTSPETPTPHEQVISLGIHGLPRASATPSSSSSSDSNPLEGSSTAAAAQNNLDYMQ